MLFLLLTPLLQLLLPLHKKKKYRKRGEGGRKREGGREGKREGNYLLILYLKFFNKYLFIYFCDITNRTYSRIPNFFNFWVRLVF